MHYLLPLKFSSFPGALTIRMKEVDSSTLVQRKHLLHSYCERGQIAQEISSHLTFNIKLDFKLFFRIQLFLSYSVRIYLYMCRCIF